MKYLNREGILSFIVVALMCTAIVISITACGGKKEHRNPTLSDPNGTIVTEHILYEDVTEENVTYWEDVDESLEEVN